MSLATNKANANLAIEMALKCTPLGSNNKGQIPLAKRHGLGPVPVTATSSISETRAYRDELMLKAGSQGSLSKILTISKAARTIGIGNCMEQAAIAFVHLYQMGVKPLDFMTFTKAGWDHGWIVIGRVTNSDLRDLSTWGPDAVWCDPWGADGGLMFTIQELVASGSVGLPAANEFHHAIAATRGNKINLNAKTLAAGQPAVWYRSA